MLLATCRTVRFYVLPGGSRAARQSPSAVQDSKAASRLSPTLGCNKRRAHPANAQSGHPVAQYQGQEHSRLDDNKKEVGCSLQRTSDASREAGFEETRVWIHLGSHRESAHGSISILFVYLLCTYTTVPAPPFIHEKGARSTHTTLKIASVNSAQAPAQERAASDPARHSAAARHAVTHAAAASSSQPSADVLCIPTSSMPAPHCHAVKAAAAAFLCLQTATSNRPRSQLAAHSRRQQRQSIA